MVFNAEDKTILVVDDEIDLCEILQFDLEDFGYKTLTASHALQALEIVENNHIDLVISDIRMPGGDGIYLLDTIRKKHFKDPPLIFVSGFADITLDEAYAKGVSNVFSKPLATEALLEYVQFTLLDPMERWKKKSEFSHPIRIVQSFPSIGSTNSPLIGRGGAFAFMNRDFPRLGSEFYFKFDFLDTHSVIEGIALCRVQKNSKDDPKYNGIGFEFLELTDESIVFINKITSENQTIAQIPTAIIG